MTPQQPTGIVPMVISWINLFLNFSSWSYDTTDEVRLFVQYSKWWPSTEMSTLGLQPHVDISTSGHHIWEYRTYRRTLYVYRQMQCHQIALITAIWIEVMLLTWHSKVWKYGRGSLYWKSEYSSCSQSRLSFYRQNRSHYSHIYWQVTLSSSYTTSSCRKKLSI